MRDGDIPDLCDVCGRALDPDKGEAFLTDDGGTYCNDHYPYRDGGHTEGGRGMTEEGTLHRHEDGREHRHFSAGFSIGGQVIADRDGTEQHSHGTLSMMGDTEPETVSGPVVWTETEGGQ